MGHRRSRTHSRSSKRRSPEMVSTHAKDKRGTHEEGREAHGKGRGEKRDRKRKREFEDSSKKKHKEKQKGKNRHHRTKEKPKDKVSRRKDCRALDYTSSESDHSTSFLSSREAFRNHSSRSPSRSRSRSRTRNADFPWEHSHTGNVDIPRACKLRRFKGNNEDDFGQIRDARKDSMQAEHDRLRAHLVRVNDSAEGAELKRRRTDIQQDGCDVTIQRKREPKRYNGRKDKVLEVELRQKALANFLRHQDVSCEMDEHKERINLKTNLGATRAAFKNGESEGATTDVDSRQTAAPFSGDAVCVLDAPVHVCANNMAADASRNFVREGSKLTYDLRSNLEEGEIFSDSENETGVEDARCLEDEKRVYHDKENTGTGDEARKGSRKEQHDMRISSTGGEREVESVSAGVDVAASDINEKGELSQGKALEGSCDLDAAAGHDIDSSFQQKTMSVMRGGEMVQVNYKVYIPKRAVELARRRLQR